MRRITVPSYRWGLTRISAPYDAPETVNQVIDAGASAVEATVGTLVHRV